MTDRHRELLHALVDAQAAFSRAYEGARGGRCRHALPTGSAYQHLVAVGRAAHAMLSTEKSSMDTTLARDGAATAEAGPGEQLVAIDVETTGVDPHHDVVIEIGAMRLDPATLAPIDEFEIAMFPPANIPVSTEAAAVNGYSEDEWGQRNALHDRSAAWLAFNRWLARDSGKVVWLGCNVQFDRAFVGPFVEVPVSRRVIDVHSAFRAWCHATGTDAAPFGTEQQRALLGVTNSSPHRALADARMAADLYRALVLRMRRTLPRETVVAQLESIRKWLVTFRCEDCFHESVRPANDGVCPACGSAARENKVFQADLGEAHDVIEYALMAARFAGLTPPTPRKDANAID